MYLIQVCPWDIEQLSMEQLPPFSTFKAFANIQVLSFVWGDERVPEVSLVLLTHSTAIFNFLCTPSSHTTERSCPITMSLPVVQRVNDTPCHSPVPRPTPTTPNTLHQQHPRLSRRQFPQVTQAKISLLPTLLREVVEPSPTHAPNKRRRTLRRVPHSRDELPVAAAAAPTAEELTTLEDSLAFLDERPCETTPQSSEDTAPPPGNEFQFDDVFTYDYCKTSGDAASPPVTPPRRASTALLRPPKAPTAANATYHVLRRPWKDVLGNAAHAFTRLQRQQKVQERLHAFYQARRRSARPVGYRPRRRGQSRARRDLPRARRPRRRSTSSKAPVAVKEKRPCPPRDIPVPPAPSKPVKSISRVFCRTFLLD